MSIENGDPELNFALETWKTSISVQQHFNTLEMQIRSIAVTVLTAVIGAAGLVFTQTQQTIRDAMNNHQPVPLMKPFHFLGLNFSTADIVILAGLIAWFAFYLMDRLWYHRLLHGSVEHAISIEKDIQQKLSYGKWMLLSTTIGKSSPFTIFGRIHIHTDTKIDLFYGFVFVLLVLMVFFVF